MSTRIAALVLTLLPLALFSSEAAAETCSGCACRGGPGYRHASGQCVGHKQLYSRCGVPPTTKCTFEGASHVGRNAVPPEWTQAQHAAWLAAKTTPAAPSDPVPAQADAR